MLMGKINSGPYIHFGSHKQLLNSIDTDFYTGKFVDRNHRSTEHILPKSKNGKSNIKNYAMTDIFVNSKRSNYSLEQWLYIHPDYLENMRAYIEKYWNTIIDKVKHGKEVKKTLKKLNIEIYIGK